MESKKIEFFNKLSFTTLLATIFISLFFFIPFTPITLDAGKGFLVSIGVTISLFFWLIARLGEGKFNFPKDRLLLFGALIPIAFLVSAVFSSSFYNSLFGAGFEIGTFGSMLILYIILFLSVVHFQTEKRFWQFLGMIFIGAIILAIFELLNIFVGLGNLFPNFFQGVTSGNLIGSWNNFISFFGLIVLLVVFTLEFLKLKKLFLWFLYSLLVVSIFFLIIINVPLVWLMIAIFSAIIFVYSISIQHAGVKIIHGVEDKKRFPFVSLVIVLISLIFLIGNTMIGDFVTKYISVSNLDIRPSIVTTSQVAWQSIKTDPLFGSGPNTFATSWALFQPEEINETIFWNTDFSNSFSFLTTILVTTGLVGFISLIVFIVILLIKGVLSLKVALDNPLSNYFIMTTLMIAVYSWILIIVYNPNIILMMMAFVSSGMLVGVLVYKNIIPIREISFLNNPRNSFFAILCLMILMVMTLSLTYVYFEKFVSIFYYSKSLNREMNIESLSKSEVMILNAIKLNKNNIYYRNLSQLYLDQIRFVLADKNASEDDLKSSLQQLVSLAEENAINAVNQNKKLYLNHLNLGNVYSSLSSLGIEGSYEKSIESFNKAKELAPNNPSIVLARASLEFLNENNEEAKQFINEALLLKTNYTDAFFLLAEIEAKEGNVSGAIKQAENAAQKSPNDSSIFFRLGMLRYSNNDYSGSISAFERAVILDPNNLNARYFLGQSYQKVNRKEDALVQYNILSTVLPDSQEIKDAISSISSRNSQAEIIKDNNESESTNQKDTKDNTNKNQ